MDRHGGFNPGEARSTLLANLWEGTINAPAICISFRTIWLLAPFLEQLARNHPERLAGLRGLIACSSSSAITKRFAANRSDRELVALLTRAEEQLLASCRRLDVPCRIL